MEQVDRLMTPSGEDSFTSVNIPGRAGINEKGAGRTPPAAEGAPVLGGQSVDQRAGVLLPADHPDVADALLAQARGGATPLLVDVLHRYPRRRRERTASRYS